MNYETLSLTNFRCYEDETVQFDTGVIVIHGRNGAGKSTLLEAAYFALYGSSALETGKTLANVVMHGKDNAEVTLRFQYNSSDYIITRALKWRGDSVSQTKCKLETPTDVYEGVTTVDNKIKSLLQMDATAFINSAYVRQGENDKLVTADQSKRKDILDNLLQIGRVDTYRERLDKIRLGIDRSVRTHDSLLADRRKKQSELVDANVNEKLASTQAQISAHETAITELTTAKEAAQKQRDELTELLDDVAEKRETREEQQTKRDRLESEIENIDDTIAKTQERLTEHQTTYNDALNKLEESELRPINVDITADTDHDLTETVETVTDAHAMLSTSVSSHSKPDLFASAIRDEYAGEIPTDSSDQFSLSRDVDMNVPDLETNVARLETAIKTLLEQITTAREDLTDAITEKKAERESINSQYDRLTDEIETLKSERADVEDEINQLKGTRKAVISQRDEKQATIDQLEKEIYDIDETLALSDYSVSSETVSERVETARDQLTEKRELLRKAQTEYDTVTAHIERAESLKENEQCPRCEQDITNAPSVTKLGDHREHRDALETQIDELTQEIDQLETRVGELTALEDKAQTRRQYVERKQKIEEKITKLDAEIEETDSSLATTQTEKERLSEQITDRSDKRDQIKDKRDKLNEQIETDTDRKQELRACENDLQTVRNALTKLTTAITQAVTVLTQLDKTQTQREEKLTELKTVQEKISQLDAELNTIQPAQLKAEQDKHQQAVTQLDGLIESRKETVTELRQQEGKLTNQVKTLNALTDEITKREQAVDTGEQLQDEVGTLLAAYTTAQEQLRQQNIAHLERVTEDIFTTLYTNETYDTVSITNDYQPLIVDKRGIELTPGDLSHGERTMFSLSLRAALYQLLVEGLNAAVPMPPLVLDEPTVNLDDSNVNQIPTLVNRMQTAGVEQIIIISHNDEVLNSATQELYAKQQTATNTSSVEQETDFMLS